MNASPTPASLRLPICAAVAAVTITTVMDATGLTLFSALPLFVLTGLFWYLGRHSRLDIGLVLGSRAGYVWALLYPLTVPGLIAAAAFAAGAVNTADADWAKTAGELALMSTTGILGTLITEEGFFRGYLWAGLKRAALSDRAVLLWTSAVFSLWHLSAVVLTTDFAPPPGQVPVFMINATLLGLNWGLMRRLSGSVLAPSLCHAVWNAVVYGLFGFGEKVGALGITNTALYGPEIGWLGLVGNAAFASVLWRRARLAG